MAVRLRLHFIMELLAVRIKYLEIIKPFYFNLFLFIENYMNVGLSCNNAVFSTGCNVSLNLVCDSTTKQCM